MIPSQLKKVFPILSFHHQATALKALLMIALGITIGNFLILEQLHTAIFLPPLLFLISIILSRKTTLLFILVGYVSTAQYLDNYSLTVQTLPVNLSDVSISYIEPQRYKSGDDHYQIVHAQNLEWRGTLAAKLSTPLQPGEQRVVSGTTEKFDTSCLPWELNSERYGRNNSIHGRISVDTTFSHRINNSLANGLYSYINSKRQTLSTNSSALLIALLQGDKSELGRGTKYIFRAGGVSHLLAISGFHIGLYILILSVILKPLPFPKSVKLILLTVLPWGILLLTGPTPSTVRSLIMSSVVLIGFLGKKPSSGLNCLGVAGVLILFINPFQLFTAGFLLSFTAVFTILLVLKLMKMKSFTSKQIKYLSLVIVPISVGLTTSPITAYFFGTTTPLGAITNILYVPLFAILMTINIPLLLFLPMTNPIVFIINKLCIFAIYILNKIVIVFNIENQIFTIVTPELLFCIIIALLFILIADKKYYIKVFIYYILIAVSVFHIPNNIITQDLDISNESASVIISNNTQIVSTINSNRSSKSMIDWMKRNSKNRNLIIKLPKEQAFAFLYQITHHCSYDSVYYFSEVNFPLNIQSSDTELIAVQDNDTIFFNDIPLSL